MEWNTPDGAAIIASIIAGTLQPYVTRFIRQGRSVASGGSALTLHAILAVCVQLLLWAVISGDSQELLGYLSLVLVSGSSSASGYRNGRAAEKNTTINRR